MRSTYTGHITSAEWRWVILVSVSLVLLAFMPYLWVLIVALTGNSDLAFMGALHDYEASAGYMTRLFQGTQDNWLAVYLHTPEVHNAALIDPVYVLLGQVSRLTSLSPIVIFHVARVGASLFMYMAVYQLAGNIWMKVRSRRIFFIIVAVASGFGWVLAPLTGDVTYLDLNLPAVFPFYSSLANVHLPLTAAALALIASVVIQVVRPDSTPAPNINNGGVLVFTLSLTLMFIYPLAFIPIGLAFLINVIISWVDDRRIHRAQFNWMLWTIVPALPMMLYYGLVLQSNTIVAEIWQDTIRTTAPNPLVLVMSFGLPLLVAVPGLIRAVRRFHRDGDQFMLTWMFIMLLLVYLPTIARTNFLIGFMIPLAYFATRAIDDYWFDHVPRRHWMRVLVAAVPLMFASNILVLLSPIILIEADREQPGVLLQQEYVEVFNWLEDQVRDGDLVLAAPQTSLWLPSWAGGRVVYGHPTETLDPAAKARAVRQWYATRDADDCNLEDFVIDGQSYPVDYVIYGPEESEFGPAVCRNRLLPLIEFDDVRIYRFLPGPAPTN
jgi:hypothetical protein